MHPQMIKQIYQVVHSSVDLFATHLNHKVSLYVSPVPVQHAWDIDAPNIKWSGLTAYAYPPMALQPSGAYNRDPTLVTVSTTAPPPPPPPPPECDKHMNNTTVGNKISLFYISL